MSTHAFVAVMALGAALLALWCHVRWPSAAPKNLTSAVLRVLVGLALMQVGVLALDAAVGTSHGVALLAIVGVVVPVLTFAFLSALWIMKVLADQLNGFA